DGDVEVIAAGDAQALDRLEAWLRIGPPKAHVTRVERDVFDGDVAHGFEVR
ncbi:MAG TPA: acylphosphatase, partial [Xanthomonadaceae bacterium]|nr:acylphosphatase [Xanthomonadaceae bacterium]